MDVPVQQAGGQIGPGSLDDLGVRPDAVLRALPHIGDAPRRHRHIGVGQDLTRTDVDQFGVPDHQLGLLQTLGHGGQGPGGLPLGHPAILVDHIGSSLFQKRAAQKAWFRKKTFM